MIRRPSSTTAGTCPHGRNRRTSLRVLSTPACTETRLPVRRGARMRGPRCPASNPLLCSARICRHWRHPGVCARPALHGQHVSHGCPHLLCGGSRGDSTLCVALRPHVAPPCAEKKIIRGVVPTNLRNLGGQTALPVSAAKAADAAKRARDPPNVLSEAEMAEQRRREAARQRVEQRTVAAQGILKS